MAKENVFYTGMVVLESLKDKKFLGPSVIKTEPLKMPDPENPGGFWHVYELRAKYEKIEKLKQAMEPGWYSHFSNLANDDAFIVFNGAAFPVNRTKPDTWQKAIEYGKTMGITEEEMDFYEEFKQTKGKKNDQRKNQK